jgi:hypothetical protein
MEKGLREVDFENVDELVQVHDYGGVQKRTAESKKAANEASKLFSEHYPECLVSLNSDCFPTHANPNHDIRF